ncbi:unnamed protein product [Paramecium octaurelia]|uniref:Uncharacterized protein n=1 Tax=Paramecium octaurelia TaxID=43137 RepID=A0A8S1T2Y8_PAROT|nr:unnamed protein product [Paramecium octaurelia]
MYHQINANSHADRKNIKVLILTTIKRRNSMDLKQSHFSIKSNATQTASSSKDMKLRRRSFSNSIPAYSQDSNRKEPKNQQDNSNQFLNKKWKEHNDSGSSSNQDNSKSNNPIKENENEIDQNDIYTFRKDEVNFRQFHENFQSDALQLEILYYWLSSFGFQRSAPFQLPPLLSYYLYSLILYRSDLQELFLQFVELTWKDEYYKKLMGVQSQYFQQKLQNQCYSQVVFHDVPSRDHKNEYMFVEYLNKIIADMNLDYNILLEDFITYFELFSFQKNNIEASLSDAYIFGKNNIAFGNIRFVFKQIDGQLIDFKQPIGKFQDKQFIDYIQFQDDFAKQVQQAEPFLYFTQYLSEPHSERTLILFLLADIYLDKSIFENLQIDLEKYKQNHQIMLSQIHLEITSENRVCNKCVGMFQMIPIQFICQKFKEKFKLEVDKKFQFIITSQYLLDPQVTASYVRYQKIWKKTDSEKFILLQQYQSKDSKLNQEEIQIQNEKELPNDYEQPSTKQYDQHEFQLVQQQDLSQQDSSQQLQQKDLQQEYLICYQEQEPTGLVSPLLLKERYCKGQFSNFKKKVTELQFTNTFFLSNELQQSRSKPHSQNDQQQLPEEGNSQSSHSSKKQRNRLLIELQSYQEKLLNLRNIQQDKPKQNVQEQQIVQKSQKTYLIYEDLLLEIRSEFYAKLIKKLTQDYQFLNTESFQLDKILQLYWKIGLQKVPQKGLINILKKDLQLNSILECGQFNMQLFIQDYAFISECITTQITNETQTKQQNCKISANFYLIKFYGLDDSGEFQIIAQSITIQSCHSLIQSLDEKFQQDIKKFQQLYIIILSVSKIKKQFTEAINNLIFSLQHPNFGLKYYFFEQNIRDQTQEDGQKSNLISEQQWILKEKDFFQHRYALRNTDCFQPFKELSENFDQDLMSFECQVHN